MFVMKKPFFLLLGLIALLSLPGRAGAQGLALGQVSGLVGDTVLVPVTVTGSGSLVVSAMTLGVNYDSTRLRCLSSLVDVQTAVTTLPRSQGPCSKYASSSYDREPLPCLGIWRHLA
jgi:hypothetical protein